MIFAYNFKEWISWRVVRAHVCTVAIALTFNATWRIPRDAFRYGALQYMLAYSVATVLVALPTSLLHLATGHLSQQDAVGVWRAVPFFKGVGYMRLLASFLASVYTVVYVGLTTTLFIYTIRNTIPFWECSDLVMTPDGFENAFNASNCLQETFLSPMKERPEYYIAIALILVAIWIIFPLVLYTPTKSLRNTFYVTGPLILTLSITILGKLGQASNLVLLYNSSEWRSFLEPHVWQAALTQALLSAQVGGGFLIAVADCVYSSTKVQWTSLAFVGTNLLTSWASVFFWYSLSPEEVKDRSLVAVLVQTYKLVEERAVGTVWPLITFAMLMVSGVVTVYSLLYPLYIHFRRIGWDRWRLGGLLISALGLMFGLLALAGSLPALALLDDVAVPLLVNVATVVEILAFVFIYGWKTLVEDIEFLTSGELNKYWIWGLCAAPGIILPLTTWWMVHTCLRDQKWAEPPWMAIAVLVTLAVALIIVMVFAFLSVVRQVQFDVFSKIQCSFKPSRHWGPRDPITHYYWLSRREALGRGLDNLPRDTYSGWQLGQMSGGTSFFNNRKKAPYHEKPRANSDDWFWTVYRKENLRNKDDTSKASRRSKSVDWPRAMATVKTNSNKDLANDTHTSPLDNTRVPHSKRVTIDCLS